MLKLEWFRLSRVDLKINSNGTLQFKFSMNLFLTFIFKLNVDMIPWRGDSGLKDGCMEGVDLEGNISKHLFIFK